MYSRTRRYPRIDPAAWRVRIDAYGHKPSINPLHIHNNNNNNVILTGIVFLPRQAYLLEYR